MKDNANKIYDILMPSLVVYTDSSLSKLPAELLIIIFRFHAATQQFPDWYQHRVAQDFQSTVDFVGKNKDKERPPVIFSQKALGFVSKKRKAEEDLEIKEIKENKENKKVKLNEDEVQSSYFNYCCIQ